MIISAVCLFKNHPNSQHNGDNNEILIRILHTILNRSINIIIDSLILMTYQIVQGKLCDCKVIFIFFV